MTKGGVISRAIGGLLAIALASTACSRGHDNALHVTSGTVPGQTTAPSVSTSIDPPATAAPAGAPTTKTTKRTTTPQTAARAAVRTQPLALPLSDTGLTRVRLTIENQAAWTSLTLDGTSIVTSQVVEASGGTRVTGLGPTIAVADAGRTVIDFVLRIATGATGISMCKNYLGPASVTLTRLTDAPTTIASLKNTGTDTSAAGGCENPAHVGVSRSALIGPIRWPARQDSRPLVLANYYPWYDTSNAGHDFGDNPVGPVDTSKTDVVASAVGLAASKGIDGFVVEYESTPALDSRIDTVYQTADARQDFQVAMVLDMAILKHRNDGVTDRGLDAILSAAAARTQHPSQLRKDGAPVLFVYSADDVDPARWASALARQRSGGFAPFVIADDPRLGSPGRYVYGTNNSPDLQTLLRWAEDALFDLRLRPGLSGQAGPLWVAPVSPGYDDRRLGRPGPMFVDRQRGQRYTDSWSAGLASLPDWIVITSWNEYFEQTHIMAGTASGSRALEQTADAAAKFHATG